jgi:PAS domain S-box-containing protein
VSESDSARIERLEAELARLRAESRATRDERDRLLGIVEATSDVVSLMDLEGNLVYLNGAGRQLVGIAPDDDLTRVRASVLHPRWAAERIRDEAVPAAILGGHWSGETAFVAHSGEEIPASQVVSVHRGSSGEAIFLSTIARDLRERKRLEAQLQQAGRMESLGRLSGAVAHDFNNLLTAVLGNADIALEAPAVAGNADLSELLTEVRDAASRGASIAQQLLTFARQQIVEPRPERLNEVVRRAQSLIARVLGPNIQFVVDLRAREDGVRLDADRFVGQVLMNLAINARDAMPGGGVLEISIGPSRTKEGAAEPGFALIEVRDTGIGMDDATKARIFEPFFTTKEVGKGSGLGLATVYGLAEQCHGSVAVESRLGQGALFRVRLPLAVESAVGSAGIRNGDAHGGRGERVLLVEDEPLVRRLLEQLLSRAGYQVVAAADAGEALSRVERGHALDLLVTDVVMAQMTGIELAAEIEAAHGAIPTVFMSGHTDLDVIRGGKLAPHQRFMPKPFAPAELLVIVRELIESTAGRRN